MTSGNSINGRSMLVGIVASLLPLYGIAFSQESAPSAPAAGVATPDSRLACPPDAKVDKDVKLIRAAYEAAYDNAKDTGEPNSLIQQLVGLSNETPDPAKKYALLLEAESVATQYENYATALDLLAKRAEKFQIDGLKLKGQLLKRLAGPKVAADLVLFDQASDTAEQAMRAERFDVAAETASLALSVARAVDREQKVEARKRGRPVGKAGKDEAGPMPVGPGLVKKATALQSQVTAAQKLFAEYGEALTDIKSQPDDAAANSVVAQYLCFVRGDWQRGLPALAKSDIDRLKTVAADEISLLNAENRDPKRVFELAGAWWSASDSKGLTDDQQAAVKDHAAGFYAEVAENLSDVLEKKLARSRLRGLEGKAAATHGKQTWLFQSPEALSDFQVGGTAEITSESGVRLGNGVASSSLNTKQEFTPPIRVEYDVSAGPDRVHDIFPGLFVTPLNSRNGVQYLFGDNGGSTSFALVFGKYIPLPHEPVKAGHIYRIAFEVDRDRKLTIIRDDKEVYQCTLPADAELRGPVQCGGGLGNVTYKRLCISNKPKSAGGKDGNLKTNAPGAIVDDVLGMKFVYVPRGSFRMGSPQTQEGRFAGENQVGVTLTTPFLISHTEVTQAQWKQVMGSEPWKGKPFVKEGDNYPASHISWEMANEFCKRLTERERLAGRVPNERYMLPTEAQWEYACRAGTQTAYSFGDDKSLLGDYAWWGGHECNGNSRTEEYGHEVATKKPNPWGIYDMHGNMWEWCSDFAAGDQMGGVDPMGPPSGAGHVLRGGGWPECPTFLRSANRTDGSPAVGNFGIRVVRVANQAANGRAQPDPGRLMGFRESIGKTIAFNVTGTANGASVWGSNPYTADSQLARAAVHAGILKPGESGVVNVTILPGQQSYEGTAGNGVTTSRWGSYSLSYRIESNAALRTTAYGAEDKDLKFTVGPEGATITGYVGNASVVTIPDTIQGQPVVGIGSDAFNRRAGIEAITLPTTVANIGNMAFYKCVDLKSVNMPENLTTIGFNAFEFCSSLGDVSIPARVTKIGAVCFVNCPNTKAISVDEANPDYASVDGILYDKEVRTLITCPAGKRGEVRIPPSVTTILGWSFLGCDKLKRIVIPETVTDIQDNAFAGCDAQRIVLGK
jgi:formylglycine-generating enzyme required for sulfatase activity